MNLSQKQYLNILGFVFAYLFVCVCICIFVHVFEFVFGAVLLLRGFTLMSALINSLVREEEVLTWSSLLTSYMQYHLHVLQYHGKCNTMYIYCNIMYNVHVLQYHAWYMLTEHCSVLTSLLTQQNRYFRCSMLPHWLMPTLAAWYCNWQFE